MLKQHVVKETDQKALEINLDERIYGTFAEIGAGQEVARRFFQVGAAAGTIAKTMSAYDKIFSDRIYGAAPSGRYVSESRVYKMLDHEYDLIEERLRDERPNTCFFAFADSVSAINYAKTNKGHGWLGLRFQLRAGTGANDIVLHVKMLDNNNSLQQQAIGVLGVNLLYAAYRYHENVEQLLVSLLDNLRDRIEIDMVRITGPDFSALDNRLVALYIVKHRLSDCAMFTPDKNTAHASEALYKRCVAIARGSYRPITLVNQDLIRNSFAQFKTDDDDKDPRNAIILAELTLNNLCNDGTLDEKDFLDRADIMCTMGYTVMLSASDDIDRLIKYLSDYKITRLGVVIGVKLLQTLIHGLYYKNAEGALLSAFGKVFDSHVRVYVYPTLQEGSSEVMTAANMPIPQELEFLYRYLMDSRRIVDVENYNQSILHIYSQQVLRMIRADETGWEALVPPQVAGLIKQNYLFGFPCERLEFEY